METPTTPPTSPCPYEHIHGDKHELFLQTGRVYCECEIKEYINDEE